MKARDCVRRFLDLSTAHLPAQMLAELDREGVDTVRALGDAAIAYRTTYGALMWVPNDPDAAAAEADTPPDAIVLGIQKLARSLDCDYVLFDADASKVDELPVFEEEPAHAH